jgi:hypothetical protein
MLNNGMSAAVRGPIGQRATACGQVGGSAGAFRQWLPDGHERPMWRAAQSSIANAPRISAK